MKFKVGDFMAAILDEKLTHKITKIKRNLYFYDIYYNGNKIMSGHNEIKTFEEQVRLITPLEEAMK